MWYGLMIFGLILDMFGFMFIFFYGIQTGPRPGGPTFILAEQVDEEEAQQAKEYQQRSAVGFIMIILGFFLQTVGTSGQAGVFV